MTVIAGHSNRRFTSLALLVYCVICPARISIDRCLLFILSYPPPTEFTKGRGIRLFVSIRAIQKADSSVMYVGDYP